jgi:hypothetical protein
MKKLITAAVWASAIATILHILLRPSDGLIYQNPTLVVALGLIGMGLCSKAKAHPRPQPAEARR